MSMEILSYYLKCKNCEVNGYVLDGIPETLEQAQDLESFGIIPKQIYELKIPVEEIKRRSNRRYQELEGKIELNKFELDLAYSVSWVDKQNKYYESNSKKIYLNLVLQLEAFYLQTYDNIHFIDAEKNRWNISYNTIQFINEHLSLLRKYHNALKNNYAASIYDVCIHIKEIEQKRGCLGTYCPISWSQRRELIQRITDRKYIAYYRNKYYNLAGPKELEEFLMY